VSARGPNVLLVGMMGSGKTSVGKVLARELDRDFIDTDSLIVDRSGVEIPDIFKYGGEKHFRKMESEVLDSLRQVSNSVIATGGGIVLLPGNLRLLSHIGIVVYLNASLPVLVKRLLGEKPASRPLLAGKGDVGGRVEEILKKRHSLYVKACDVMIKVDSPKTSKRAVADQVIENLTESGYV